MKAVGARAGSEDGAVRPRRNAKMHSATYECANDTVAKSCIPFRGFMLKSITRWMRQRLRYVAEQSSLGYRILLRSRALKERLKTGRRPISGLNTIIGHPGKPHAPWHNAVLQADTEKNMAVARAVTLGLPSHIERSKNWDSLAALDCILANTRPGANILDAGAELYSVILPWLFLYGYRKLHGINLAFQERTHRGPIVYDHGDITHTVYEPGSFDAVTCLSVVEHGVDLTAYFREMSRILKPGGILVTSTDYWDTPVDTRGQAAFGVPVHIFTELEIKDAIHIAERFGFELTSPVQFGCKEKVVRWLGLDYTFILFSLRKVSDEGRILT